MGSRISSTLSVACRDLSIRQREQAAAEERFIPDIHNARTRRDRYSLLLRRARHESEKWDNANARIFFSTASLTQSPPFTCSAWVQWTRY